MTYLGYGWCILLGDGSTCYQFGYTPIIDVAIVVLIGVGIGCLIKWAFPTQIGNLNARVIRWIESEKQTTGKDMLLPKETKFDKYQAAIRNFHNNVGIFKTFGFVALIPISLQVVRGLQIFQIALVDQKLTIGEYVSCMLISISMLIVIVLYKLYYLDLILKWGFKECQ